MKLSLTVLLAVFLVFGTAVAQAASDPQWERTVSHSPISVRAGQYVVTFHTMVESRQGPVRNLEIRGGVDGVELLRKTIPQLGPNQKMAVSFRWKPKPGKHRAFFQIDPQNKIADSNPGNNRIQLSFNVARMAQAAPRTGMSGKVGKAAQAKLGPAPGAALPDLSVVEMTVYNPQNPSAGRDDFHRGDPMVVEATIKNLGQVPSGAFWVQLEVKSQKGAAPAELDYEKQSAPSLRPGQSRVMIFNLGHQHSPAQAIYYEFTATVDYNKRIIEFD